MTPEGVSSIFDNHYDHVITPPNLIIIDQVITLSDKATCITQSFKDGSYQLLDVDEAQLPIKQIICTR